MKDIAQNNLSSFFNMDNKYYKSYSMHVIVGAINI